MTRTLPTAKTSLAMRAAPIAVLAAAIAQGWPVGAGAQQTPPPVEQKSTAGKATKPATPVAPGESGLKARVDSLEEQLVDMQVLVGTLESLAKSGGTSAAPGAPRPAGGGEQGRVETLENQVRALSNQVQALSDQVRSMGGTPRRGDASAPPPVANNPNNAFDAPSAPVAGDAIGGLIDAPATQGVAAAPTPAAGAPPSAAPSQVMTAALPPAGDITNPKQLYETAYGYLLQRDYGAAEAGFDDFLKRFPSDSLAGNAQYWLGETHFVRGQYKAAAGAFLKGYQTYAQSSKAPDSLLKLAMSLDRLGQKDAACSSYNELNTKFPNAPQSVRTRAQSERQRVGCP